MTDPRPTPVPDHLRSLRHADLVLIRCEPCDHTFETLILELRPTWPTARSARRPTWSSSSASPPRRRRAGPEGPRSPMCGAGRRRPFAVRVRPVRVGHVLLRLTHPPPFPSPPPAIRRSKALPPAHADASGKPLVHLPRKLEPKARPGFSRQVRATMRPCNPSRFHRRAILAFDWRPFRAHIPLAGPRRLTFRTSPGPRTGKARRADPSQPDEDDDPRKGGRGMAAALQLHEPGTVESTLRGRRWPSGWASRGSGSGSARGSGWASTATRWRSGVPNAFFREWIQGHFAGNLIEAAEAVTGRAAAAGVPGRRRGRAEVGHVIDPPPRRPSRAAPAGRRRSRSAPHPPRPRRRPRPPERPGPRAGRRGGSTTSSTGPGNRLAHAAAPEMVAVGRGGVQPAGHPRRGRAGQDAPAGRDRRTRCGPAARA